MLNFKKNNLVQYTGIALLILLLSGLVPALRPLTLNILKYPLELFNLFGREIEGIIFYHSNYIENQQLKKEVGLLRQKLNLANELGLENKRLNELLSFKQKTSYRVVAAQMIARSPDNWSSMVIIDKGSSSGIRRGSVVMNYLGLIGRVTEISSALSKVMLVNDPNLSVSGIIQRSRQEGLVIGNLGSTLLMKYIPKDADVKISDTVITSGLTDRYPKGIIIGTVVELGEELSGLSRYCVIKPAVNLSSIEEVLVIIP